MKTKFIILILAITLFNLYSDETAVINIDLDAALSMSYRNNPEYKKAGIEIVRKKLALATLWSKFLVYPLQSSMSASLSKTYRNPDADYQISSSSQNNDSNLSFSIDASYTVRVSDYFSAMDTVNGYNQEKILFKKISNSLIKSVTASYFKLVMLEDKIALIERELSNAKIRFDDITKRYKNGYSSELDRLKAEINYLSLIPELDNEKNNYMSELINFKNMLGLSDKDPIKLTTVIPDIKNLIIDEKFNSDNNYDVLLADKEYKASINNLNISATGFLPSFRVGYSFNAAFKRDAFQDSWFANTDDWDTYTNKINLTFSLPLQTFLPFSKEQDYLIDYINQVRISKINRSVAISGADKELAVLNDAIKNDIKNMDSLLRNSGLAEKIFKLSETEYNNGNLPYNDLIEAEQGYEESKFRLLNAKINLIINILEYDYLLNNDYYYFNKIRDNK